MHILLLSVLLLMSCRKTETNTAMTTAAKNAILIFPVLDQRLSSPSQPSVPSAPMGIFTSLYLSLSRATFPSAAFKGITIQFSFLPAPPSNGKTGDFELLEKLNSALSIGIPDFLNRSSNRASALDAYVASLKDISLLAQERSGGLKPAQVVVRHEALRDRKDASEKVVDRRVQSWKVEAVDSGRRA